MSNQIRLTLVAIALAVQPPLVQAALVDVDGDGRVGPQEVFDLLLGWKGPALPQTWQVNGTSIFYNAGNVGIWTGEPGFPLTINAFSYGWVQEDGGIEVGSFINPKGGWLGTRSNHPLHFFTNDSNPHVTVTTSGSVGIGTETPLSSKLDVFTVGGSTTAILGRSVNGHGIRGISDASGGVGVLGESGKNGTGVLGSGQIGVRANAISAGEVAIQGTASQGALAGKFEGDVDVTGTVLKSGDSSRIDHPLDPANKYLFHSSVESSEMKNVYDGVVVTDGDGHAEVSLPDWFEALYRDFRYQLTVIGEFAQAIVERKIQDNRFTIQTDKPNVEVSWQVTGIRNDLYAKAHPLEVEKTKPDKERGKYLAPALYGQPKEKGIAYWPESQRLVSPASSER